MKAWIAAGLSVRVRAERAWRIRHEARLEARAMMADPTEIELLRVRDMAVYSSPDGPTFEFLVEQGRRAGLEENAIYEAIIDGSYRTDPEINRRLGLQHAESREMSTKVRNYLEEKIVWKQGINPLYPYVADFQGERCLIRINDFPDDNLYTLIVNDREVASFDDWPKPWSRL